MRLPFLSNRGFQISRLSSAVLCVAVLLCQGRCVADIRATFDGFNPAERAVAAQAIEAWYIADPYIIPEAAVDLDILFRKGFVPPGALAVASTLDGSHGILREGPLGPRILGLPTDAVITIPTPPYWADPTPANDIEFAPAPTADPNIFDDAPNVNFYRNMNSLGAAAGGPVGQHDLLTILTHEVGHTLGWNATANRYRGQMTAPFFGLGGIGDLANFIESNTFGPLKLDGDGIDGGLGDSPRDAVDELAHLHRTGFASDLMSTSGLPVNRRILKSPLDADVLERVFGYHARIDNPITGVTVKHNIPGDPFAVPPNMLVGVQVIVDYRFNGAPFALDMVLWEEDGFLGSTFDGGIGPTFFSDDLAALAELGGRLPALSKRVIINATTTAAGLWGFAEVPADWFPFAMDWYLKVNPLIALADVPPITLSEFESAIAESRSLEEQGLALVIDTTIVPEPSTLVLLLVGFVGISRRRSVRLR